MSIVVNVDVMMAKRKISSQELAEKIGITQANLSILKTGKAKAIRFSTLEAICKALDCQPGDILEYREQFAVRLCLQYKNKRCGLGATSLVLFFAGWQR